MNDNIIFHYIKMKEIENQIISYLYQNKDKIDNFKDFTELYKDIS